MVIKKLVHSLSLFFLSPFRSFVSLSFLVPLSVYIATTARTITSYGDSAELAMASYTLSGGHPPGYPLYILLGKFFTLIPFGSIAFRVNLLSCFLGALTIVFVFLILQRFIRPLSAVFFSSLIIAFSYSFWLYAITSEVFVLNNLIAVLIVYISLLYRERSERRDNSSYRLLYLLSFLYGLGFSNHTSIVLLGPAVLYLVFITDKGFIKRYGLRMGLFFLLGLTPYLQLIYSSFVSHYPAFGNLPSFTRYFQYITRSDYGGFFSAGTVSTSPTGYWNLYFYFLKLFFTRYIFFAPFVAIFFIIVGFYKKGVKEIFLSLIFIITAVVFPLYSFRGIDGNDLHVLGVAERFSQLGFLFLGLVFLIGLYSLLHTYKGSLGKRVFHIFTFLLFLFLLISNFPVVDKHTYTLAKQYSLNILNQVEDNSIIMTTDDITDLSLLYFINAEHKKPNVRIVSMAFLSNKWYQHELKKMWPDLYKIDSQYQYAIIRDIISSNRGKRPVYVVMFDDPYPMGYDGNPHFFTPQGLLLRADDSATIQSVQQQQQANYWGGYNLDGLDRTYQDPFATLTKNNYAFRMSINAKVYQRAKCLECAKKELERAVKFDPDDMNYQSALETIKLPEDRPQKRAAADYLDVAYGFIKASGYNFDLNLHRAIWELEQARVVDPSNEEVRGTLGELYEYFGAYRDAIKEYESAHTINPNKDWKQRADTVRRKAPKDELE